MKKGVFYGVGIGPGDPELMTLKAVRVLERCPVVAAPRTKSGGMLALDIASRAVDLKGKTVVPLDFSMDRDVAMLNLGDVSIYATYSYLMEILRAQGYETVMVPGVPSFCAVAARLGISLTEMDTPLHIAPGSMDLDEVLDQPGTKVLMKSGRQLPAVLEALETRGKLGTSMLVQNCGLPGEDVCADLSQSRPEGRHGYFSTIIVKE